MDPATCDFARLGPSRRFAGCWLLAVVLGGWPLAALGQSSEGGLRLAIPVKVQRYAQRLVERYDQDGDGLLDEAEAGRMRGQPGRADGDGDGKFSARELAEYIARYGQGRRIRLMPSAAEYLIQFPSPLDADREAVAGGELPTVADRLPDDALVRPEDGRDDRPAEAAGYKRFAVSPARIPAGLPDWFRQRDRDGDLQLTVEEFAPRATARDLEEFGSYDANRDGLVTAWEYLGIPVRPRRRTANEDAGETP